MAGWVEFTLLRLALQKRIGKLSLTGARVWRAWAAGLVAGAVGFAAHRAQIHYLPALRPILYGPAVLSVYGGVYLFLSALIRVSRRSTANFFAVLQVTEPPTAKRSRF